MLIYNHIISGVRESYTRITQPKIGVTDENLFVRFSILPPPPAIALFTLFPFNWVLGGAHSTVSNVDSRKSTI